MNDFVSLPTERTRREASEGVISRFAEAPRVPPVTSSAEACDWRGGRADAEEDAAREAVRLAAREEGEGVEPP